MQTKFSHMLASSLGGFGGLGIYRRWSLVGLRVWGLGVAPGSGVLRAQAALLRSGCSAPTGTHSLDR